MIKKFNCGTDVVSMAYQRIKNTFDSAERIILSISGGKDSIILNDLIFKMVQRGMVDKSKLAVDFVDEEAIYPCVEKIVKNMRVQWMSIGVPFNWWCVQVKHYNCFNSLSQDESFICWDETKKDVWVREKPPFAQEHHELLVERQDTYQHWMDKRFRRENAVTFIGLRASESIQRRNILVTALTTNKSPKIYPIYDWTDKDIWKYIMDNGLEFPDAYVYMYQIGIPKNRLRISQFFSVDTAKSLVNMCEYYPKLFDKICKREPNAYMAMLYYDTEFFRHSKAKGKKKSEEEEKDYKQMTLDAMVNPNYNNTEDKRRNVKSWRNVIFKLGPALSNKDWKYIYEAVIGGDPKGRALRAFYNKFALGYVCD